MTIDKLNVTEEALENAIRSFVDCKNKFEDAYNAMNAEMTSINSEWDGMASEAFFNKFSELFQNLRTSEAGMEKMIGDLDFSKEAYERVEKENEQLYQNQAVPNPFA